MMRRAAALLVMMLALPAFANITSGSLIGTVSVGGAPARSVTVTAESAALQAPRITNTGNDGRYRLGELPPGTYDVTFSLAAHTTLTKRAIVELGRVARADATLEPNADEDATTSTAITVSVAETFFPTTHFDDRSLDRLPYGRTGSASLAPGFGYVQTLVDGVPTELPGEETIDQLTVVTSSSPVEWETFGGTALAMRTRPSQEELFFTLRDTITNGFSNFGEATAGGHILPQRLWFFAGAWAGRQDFPFITSDRDGALGKLDAQLGASHHVALSYQHAYFDTAAVRYAATIGPNFTSELIAARVDDRNLFTGRASYDFGPHLLTGGYTDSGIFFASDRWSSTHWNVYAGVRRENDDDFSPRAAISYDLHGNGAQAIIATYGEYDFDLRVSSLGFASAIGNAGSARADVLRREGRDGFWQNALHLDARYRLFDRFEAGATYALTNQQTLLGALNLEQEANVWFGAEVPLASHEFGATLVQHFYEVNERNFFPTDVALRYAIANVLLAADVTNAFDVDVVVPRAWRLWVRLRL